MAAGTRNIEAIYPLTPAQEGILFHTLYAPDAPLYFQQYTCTLRGDLDLDQFQQSWQLVIGRHPVLRSLLTWEERSRPLQVVKSRVEPEWRIEDWRDQPAGADTNRLEQYLEADRRRGFNLEAAPLMRFALFRTAADSHHFVWSHHHVVLDGWSLGIVLDEVFDAYESLRGGKQPTLPPSPDYRTFIEWSVRQDFTAAEDYWRRQLGGFTQATLLQIASDKTASPWAEHHREVAVRLSKPVTTQLGEFARRSSVTLSTVLRAAWAILLSRYAGSDDVVFGTTFAGRPPELEGSLAMVGLFINTLPVRLRVPSDEPLVEWLRVIHSQQVDSVPFETTPLLDVQRWSDIPIGQPLFQTLLVFENVPTTAGPDRSLQTTDDRYLQRSNYPLALLVMPREELELVLLHDVDRFDPSLIDRMAGQMTRVLEAMATGSHGSVADLPILPEEEADEILRRWNDTSAEYDSDVTVTRLIDDIIRQRPDAAAVSASGATFSYAELGARADAIARILRAHGVQPNDRVAIALERSAGAIAAILGVLRADGAYVPIDPDTPRSRRDFMIDSTSAGVLIVGPDTPSANRPDSVPELRIDRGGVPLDAGQSGADGPAWERSSGPDDLVYVMHTSGSTGRPKGVAIAHRNLMNSVQARAGVYREPVDSFLLMPPLFFDSSIAGLFWTLTEGGMLVIPEPGMEQEVHRVAALIRDQSVTHTLMLPSIYELLIEHAPPGSLASLREVIVAGEPCSPSVVRRHFEALPETLLYNEYGPTEATVWSTVEQLGPEYGEPAGSGAARIPIGRPIANTAAFVLDERLRPVPVGVMGELHLAGDGLAVGYLGRPDLTAERFVSVDIDGYGRVRLYRTGDLARFLPDGSLDLLGRTDLQVKIRGQRIELSEVERVLEEHPAVHGAAVVLSAGNGAAEVLVAYAESTEEPATLRTFLAERLPETMIPAMIVPLQQLPRGTTGKLDRSALPDPGDTIMPQTEQFVAPTGEAEATLASIWESVLGVEPIGVTDNFFELGGDSILSIRIIARAIEAGLDFTPRQLFEHPTISELAALAAQDDP